MGSIVSNRSDVVTLTIQDYPLNLQALRKFVAEADRLELAGETPLEANVGNGLHEVSALRLTQVVRVG